LVDGLSVNISSDATLSGSARSVNVVASATHSPYYIATGSNDGSVKFWDLRHPRFPAFNLLSHGSAVRSLTFGQTPNLPVHVVLGLESGMIFRYDLRVRDPTKGYHMKTNNELYR
jgi:WD40 repeat protein